ncbi:MAG: hypothetical protein AB7L90_04740 [Hyphomicrobiaceae bacterium]
MITIQSGMLIALGFLVAVLLGLLIAPALWRRAVRLTSRRIKTAIPLSEMEIEADRDRIRAEYAIKMHKLEMLVEQVKLAGARQQIEINRRDARVNMLEADLEELRASYEEAQNARRVLEQTITARLPRVEERLADTKKVVHTRDREIADLNAAAEKQSQALAAARSLNDEQRQEIERLNEGVPERGGLLGGGSRLRSELQALKAKTREQAQQIERLQGLSDGRRKDVAGSEADAALSNAGESARNDELHREIAELRERAEVQAAEIARLKMVVKAFEKVGDGGPGKSAEDSGLAPKARADAPSEAGPVAMNGQDGRGAAVSRRSLAERVSHTRMLEDPDQTDGSDNRPVEVGRTTSGASTFEAGGAADALVRTSAGGSGVPHRIVDAHSKKAPSGAGSAGTEDVSRAEPRRAQSGSDRRMRLLDRLAGLSRTS